MNKLFMPFMALVCLLFAGCDEEDHRNEMEWTYEILTPENVKLESSSLDGSPIPEFGFKANGKEGDIVMTCENYDVIHIASVNSDTYDCGWVTAKVE